MSENIRVSEVSEILRQQLEGIETKVQLDEIGTVLQVSDGIETMTLEDIAIGEVYIAGGQSNMEFPLRYEKYHEQVMGLDDHELRFFDVPKKFYEEQDSDFDYSAVGRWRRATSEENLGYFSAVAFYFGDQRKGRRSGRYYRMQLGRYLQLCMDGPGYCGTCRKTMDGKVGKVSGRQGYGAVLGGEEGRSAERCRKALPESF